MSTAQCDEGRAGRQHRCRETRRSSVSIAGESGLQTQHLQAEGDGNMMLNSRAATRASLKGLPQPRARAPLHLHFCFSRCRNQSFLSSRSRQSLGSPRPLSQRRWAPLQRQASGPNVVAPPVSIHSVSLDVLTLSSFLF